VNQQKEGTRPLAFADDMATLVESIERFVSRSNNVSAEHPLFGRFNGKQWGRFHYKHTDHHLRQFGV
jgi:hypothetical protein